ncbi:MAG: hypothetical protein Kilf2KO_26590 [Rhodospirillales bacterium]
MNLDRIEQLQRNLNDLGRPLKVDGIAGPKTQAAAAAVVETHRRAGSLPTSGLSETTAAVVREAAEVRRVAKRQVKGVVVRQGALLGVGVTALIDAVARTVEAQQDRLASGDWLQIALGLAAVAIPLLALGKHIWNAGWLGNAG